MAQGKDMTSVWEIVSELQERFTLSTTPALREQLERIVEDHDRLVHFRSDGVKDAQRGEIYGQLLDRVKRLRANYFMDLHCQMPGWRDAKLMANRSLSGGITVDYIKEVEETFVQELAMLTLKPEKEQARRSRALHDEHFKQVEQIFSSLLTSYQWTEAEAEDYLALFLSPSCDTNDLQVMVSALTMNVMRSFDANKAWVLASLYDKVFDQRVRQRAFVGWAFTLADRQGSLNTKFEELSNQLIAKPEVRRDLLELQKQYLLCMDIEKDCKKLEKDIFPKIMRNSPFDITPTSIKERPRDELKDILNPGDEELRIKEIEACMETIQKMKEEGSDVYYASFSKMKNDIFFHKLVNWFMPFYKEHPMMRAYVDSLKDNTLFNIIRNHSSFCDSDCYSFVSGAANMLRMMPENMKDALGTKEMVVGINTEEEKEKPTNLRLMYLHDLYRFAKLSPLAKFFTTPFDKLHTLYPPLFFHHWEGSVCQAESFEIAEFLYAQKKYHDFRRVTASIGNMPGKNFHQMMAGYYKYLWEAGPDTQLEKRDLVADRDLAAGRGDTSVQVESYLEEDLKVARERFFTHINAALAYNESDISTLRILVSAQLSHGMYEDAVPILERLVNELPNNKKFVFDYATALLKLGEAETAANYVYKLSFEMPRHPDVMRLEAWLYLLRKQPEKAQRIYNQLIESKDLNIVEDYLNAGYCAWFLDDWHEAVPRFKRFVEGTGKDKTILRENFAEDAHILDLYAVDEIDRYIMVDLVMQST